MNKKISYYKGVMLWQFGPPMSALGLQDIINTVSIIICIGPTGLRLRHIGKTDPPCGTVQSAFARAASLAQLVLASGPSPRPWYDTQSKRNAGKRHVVSDSVFHFLSKGYKDKCELLSRLPSATRPFDTVRCTVLLSVSVPYSDRFNTS